MISATLSNHNRLPDAWSQNYSRERENIQNKAIWQCTTRRIASLLLWHIVYVYYLLVTRRLIAGAWFTWKFLRGNNTRRERKTKNLFSPSLTWIDVIWLFVRDKSANRFLFLSFWATKHLFWRMTSMIAMSRCENRSRRSSMLIRKESSNAKRAQWTGLGVNSTGSSDFKISHESNNSARHQRQTGQTTPSCATSFVKASLLSCTKSNTILPPICTSCGQERLGNLNSKCHFVSGAIKKAFQTA